MKPPQYEEAQLLPLVSDTDIENRVTELIGRASVRQLWLLFLDGSDVQLPLLIPVDALPSEPTPEQATAVVARVSELMTEIGAASLILVWERYGAAALTARDAAWLRSLHDECGAARVALRATLLSHRMGVRWIVEEDFRAPTGRS